MSKDDYVISIHVLRVEDDPVNSIAMRNLSAFQSTSSVWRTTRRRWAAGP